MPPQDGITGKQSIDLTGAIFQRCDLITAFTLCRVLVSFQSTSTEIIQLKSTNGINAKTAFFSANERWKGEGKRKEEEGEERGRERRWEKEKGKGKLEVKGPFQVVMTLTNSFCYLNL